VRKHTLFFGLVFFCLFFVACECGAEVEAIDFSKFENVVEREDALSDPPKIKAIIYISEDRIIKRKEYAVRIEFVGIDVQIVQYVIFDDGQLMNGKTKFGQLFIIKDGKWKEVSTEEYLGTIKKHIPGNYLVPKGRLYSGHIRSGALKR